METDKTKNSANNENVMNSEMKAQSTENEGSLN